MMPGRSSSVNLKRFFIWIFVPVLLCTCGQPERRLPVDKAALLLIIQRVAQAKNTSFEQGVKMLRFYEKQYEFVVAEKSAHPAKLNMVLVKISREKDFEWFDSDIPKDITTQLEFRDLEPAFGEGIESPSAKEPFFFSVMYHFQDAGEVAIMSTSRKPPQAHRPEIYQITLM